MDKFAFLNHAALASDKPSNVAFYIGEKAIYWYGIVIAVGLIMGVIVGLIEAKRRGYRAEMVLDLILVAVPICIIFARLYYVVFEWQNYAADPIRILYIWEGGLAIYGAVIGGVIAAIIFYYWRRVSIGEVLDVAAPGLIIGQAIGRWGNFANQEAFGRAVTDTSLQWFPYAVKIDAGKTIDGVFYAAGYYYATFFYESMWNLIVFAVLMLVRKKVKIRGGIFALYVTLYGLGRFWIEQLRTDSLMWHGYRVSQAVSELLVIGGLAYLIYMYFSKRNYYSYSGYYSLGLSEEQIDAMKGKNALLNAQQDLKKAQWFAEIMREDGLTSPHYRAVKEKADQMAEKAQALTNELGAEDSKTIAAQKKAEMIAARAEKIFAQIKLEGRLALAQKDADKAAEFVESLKENDPDSPEVLAAQEKAELANLLVEKIKDNMEEDKKSRDAWLEKSDVNIAVLEEKIKKQEERIKGKTKESKPEKDGKEDQPEKDVEIPVEKTKKD